MNAHDVAALVLIVVIATMVTFWLGPLWFILLVGILCCVWVVTADWRPL